jgi:hypothetical protein
VPARRGVASTSDQIHASVVSVLLALMDGVAGRGAVAVVGATNRCGRVGGGGDEQVGVGGGGAEQVGRAGVNTWKRARGRGNTPGGWGGVSR